MWELDNLRNTYIWKGKLEEVHLYQIKILASNKIKGFIKMDMLNKDGICILEYKIENKISLDKYFAENYQEQINYQGYIERLLEAMKTADNYLLSKENILLNPLQIFLDQKTKELEIIYFPKKDYGLEASEDIKALTNLLKPLIRTDKIKEKELLINIENAIEEKQSNYRILSLFQEEEENDEKEWIEVNSEEFMAEEEEHKTLEIEMKEKKKEENNNTTSNKDTLEISKRKTSFFRIVLFCGMQILVGANIWFGFTNFLLKYKSYQTKMLLIGAGLIVIAVIEILIIKILFGRRDKKIKSKEKIKKEKKFKGKKTKEIRVKKVKGNKEKSCKSGNAQKLNDKIRESKWNWYEDEEEQNIEHDKFKKQFQEQAIICMEVEEIGAGIDFREEISEEVEIADEAKIGDEAETLGEVEIQKEARVEEASKKEEVEKNRTNIKIEKICTQDIEKELCTGEDCTANKREEEALILPFERVYLVDSGKVHIPILKSVFIMGKMKSIADLVIQDNRVSRVHCKIIREGKKCYIYDLESKNGTYVNALKLQEHMKVPLFDGDRIKIVDYEYTIRYY